MIDIAITKLSSKGQIVIPLEMRGNSSEGEELLIIKNGENLILKKISNSCKNFDADVTFAKRTEEALKMYEKGHFREMNARDFVNEIEKW